MKYKIKRVNVRPNIPFIEEVNIPDNAKFVQILKSEFGYNVVWLEPVPTSR